MAATCTSKAKYSYSCECGESGNKMFEYGEYGSHKMNHYDGKESTCIGEGWYEYDECIYCGFNTKRIMPKKEHDLVHHEAKQPTCTEEGWYEYDSCKNCNYSTKIVRTATGHIFDKKVATDDYLATDATCRNKATYYYSCICGLKGTNTFEYGDYKEHEYNHYDPLAPTCTTYGYNEHYACGNCLYSPDLKLIEPLGHSFTHYVSDDNATCTQNCTETAKCDRCDTYDTRDIGGSMLPHIFDKKISTDEHLKSAATCTSRAVYYYSCECGVNGTQTFISGNYLPHEYETVRLPNSENFTGSDLFCVGKCKHCGKYKFDLYELEQYGPFPNWYLLRTGDTPILDPRGLLSESYVFRLEQNGSFSNITKHDYSYISGTYYNRTYNWDNAVHCWDDTDSMEKITFLNGGYSRPKKIEKYVYGELTGYTEYSYHDDDLSLKSEKIVEYVGDGKEDNRIKSDTLKCYSWKDNINPIETYVTDYFYNEYNEFDYYHSFSVCREGNALYTYESYNHPDGTAYKQTKKVTYDYPVDDEIEILYEFDFESGQYIAVHKKTEMYLVNEKDIFYSDLVDGTWVTGKDSEVIKYDDSNNVIQSKFYETIDGSKKLKYYYAYEYDESGRNTKNSYFINDEECHRIRCANTRQYEYDDLGNVIVEIYLEYDIEDDITSGNKYVYSNDYEGRTGYIEYIWSIADYNWVEA